MEGASDASNILHICQLVVERRFLDLILSQTWKHETLNLEGLESCWKKQKADVHTAWETASLPWAG